MGVIRRAEAKLTEKWLLSRLTAIAKKYVKERYPKGLGDNKCYLTMCIISSYDENKLSIMINNEYEGVGDQSDIEYPINVYKRIKV